MKEVLQSLVDDSLVNTDKCGVQTVFWALPSESSQKVRFSFDFVDASGTSRHTHTYIHRGPATFHDTHTLAYKERIKLQGFTSKQLTFFPTVFFFALNAMRGAEKSQTRSNKK